MYPVSDDYKLAMKQPVQRFRLKGTVGEEKFTEKNVLSGSFSITNQCSDGTNVQIGQVYIGELNATFMNVPLDRYAWRGKKVIPSAGLRLQDGTYEDVPLGVYTVASAKYTASGMVVKAYDNMQLFDKTAAITETAGKLYDLLLIACKECGVELGQTEQEIGALPNGNVTMACYSQNDIETWRDYLSWLAQAACCNALIDRTGKLILKPYSQDVVDTIDAKHRFTGCEFSDYSTRYTGLSVTEAETQKTKYYGDDVDDGLTYNLGMNPFLQYGVAQSKDSMRKNILDTLGAINFVPFQAEMIGTPAYDLMDALCFEGGLADGNALSVITKYTYTFDGKYSVEGVGEDPALSSARSKTDKNIAGLLANTDAKTLRYTIYENADEIGIKDGASAQIMKIRFGTAETTTAVFEAEILVSVETTEAVDGISDAVATVTYFLDDVEVETRHPKMTWQDGNYILTLHYAIQSLAAAVHRWQVNITMNGGALSIEPQGIHALITGQGMAAETKWDGTIDAKDEISTYKLSDLIWLHSFSDTANIHLADVNRQSFSDRVNLLRVQPIKLASFTDDASSALGMFFSPSFNADLLTKTAGVTDGAFTNGMIQTPAIVETRKISSDGKNVQFTISFDGGNTWLGWTGQEWSTSKTMNSDELESLSETQLSGQSIMVKAAIGSGASLSELSFYGGKVDET